MKRSKWLTGTAVLGVTVALSGVALYAQPANPPADNAPPNGPNGQNRPNGPRGNNRNMTPEQRQQWMQQMQQMREQRVRGVLAEAGFTDVALQDAVVAFVNTQDQATQELQRKQRDLARAAREGMADAQLATLLADFRTAVAAEKTRRADATKALDAKIGFSAKPRLDALLTTAGVIGDESSVVEGFGGGRGMGGFGGGFGGFGGGRGGRGGQGGRPGGRGGDGPNGQA